MFQQIITAYCILARRWISGNHALTRLSLTRRRAMIAVFALTLLVTTSACQQSGLAQNAPILAPSPTSSPTQHLITLASSPTPTLTPLLPNLSPTPYPQKPSPTPTSTSSSRNHVHSWTLFVRVTFTPSSAYDQAVAALEAAGESLYPWNCDDPRAPTPPTVSQQSAVFASTHVLFISYPSLPGLDTLASSPQVLSIDPQVMSMCP